MFLYLHMYMYMYLPMRQAGCKCGVARLAVFKGCLLRTSVVVKYLSRLSILPTPCHLKALRVAMRTHNSTPDMFSGWPGTALMCNHPVRLLCRLNLRDKGVVGIIGDGHLAACSGLKPFTLVIAHVTKPRLVSPS